MARFLVISLLVAGACADAGLRGAQRGPWDDLLGKASDASDSAIVKDPMDAYIKSSQGATGNVWFNNDADTKKEPPALKSVHSSLEKDESNFFGVRDFGHSSDETQSAFKPSQESKSIFGAAKDKDEDTVSFHAPSKSSIHDSIAMPYSAPDASSGGGGGAVIDVKLDSELQEESSLLQLTHNGARVTAAAAAATAPNVEAAVAGQRLEDVYIHDQFSTAADEDAKKEEEVNADRDMKA
jgi:hypothetical protein